MKISMMKTESGLKPIYQNDFEEYNKLEYTGYMVTIKRPRNLRHHNKYWSLCTLLAEQVSFEDKQITKEQASKWLLYKAGEVEYIAKSQKGELIVAPKSISFESMSQDKFEIFFDKIISIVAEKLEVTEEEINKNLIWHYGE